MKSLEYMKHKNFHKGNNSDNWKKGCYFCKKAFEETEKFIRIDVKETIFRGDDEVYCFHNECFKRGRKKLEEEYECPLKNECSPY